VSGEALAYASDLAKKLDAGLSVLRVIKDGDVGNANEELCEWVPEDARSKCSLTEIVRKGDITSQIEAARKELGADLVVISTEHRMLGDETLDERTFEIIRRSRCPVITVSDQ